MQEPIDAIGAMVSRWREGWEMVYAVRAHRRGESRAKRALARPFYGLVNLGAEVPIPPERATSAFWTAASSTRCWPCRNGRGS